MDSVQAQTIDVILLEPIERVMNEKVTYHSAARAIEIDGLSPRRAVSVREEVFRVHRKIVSFGTEVVVDHVQEHHEIVGVGRLNEAFQIIRASVAGGRSIGQNSVVAPVPLAGKTSERHEFNSRNSQLSQVSELLFGAGDSSLGREGAHV